DPQLFDVLRGRNRRIVGRSFGGQLGSAGAKSLSLPPELAHTFAEHLFGHRAVLKCVHVAVDGRLGPGEFGVGGSEIVAAPSCAHDSLSAPNSDRSANDAGVSVQIA